MLCFSFVFVSSDYWFTIKDLQDISDFLSVPKRSTIRTSMLLLFELIPVLRHSVLVVTRGAPVVIPHVIGRR